LKDYIWLIPLIPLLGVIFNGLFGRAFDKSTRSVGGLFACGTVLASFLMSLTAVIELSHMPEGARLIVNHVFPWIVAGNFEVWYSLALDPLSAVMILVVSGVGFLIHVYSLGYMADDDGYSRFFAYLNLFMFSMLTLVLADSFLLMFVGWELVGLCSYLLIGFWLHKDSAANAGKKAFIVNRVGDFGVLCAIFAIFGVFGTLDFQKIFAMIEHNATVTPWFLNTALPVRDVLHTATPLFGVTLVTAICLALFLGATGKSAQIPLYVWLPDAMEGPTPVSALIHAATMVTAGVYMIARTSVMFALAPQALMVVAVIGCATAVFAATIGVAQYDIKRVLAYSTVSQLGFMFLACGVGAYAVAIFHLATHAFFKALLFLGSGSVIHGMHDEQDMRHMGGLAGKMKITYITMLIATLAIAGIPFFAGFFSKDEILWKAFSTPLGEQFGRTLWMVGSAAAFLTAFYMFRLIYMTFSGKPRWHEHTHPHESPLSMTAPLMILAVFAIIGGWVGTPPAWPVWQNHSFYTWLHPMFAQAEHLLNTVSLAHPYHIPHEAAEALESQLMWGSVVVALAGIAIATFFYFRTNRHDAVRRVLAPVHFVLNHKYFIDEIYTWTIVEPGKWFSSLFLWKITDVGIIDGLVNAVAGLVGAVGGMVRRIQTGVVLNYALVFVLGVLVILYFVVWPGV
jgi:NADH-quinone oxidoreductase subunit L